MSSLKFEIQYKIGLLIEMTKILKYYVKFKNSDWEIEWTCAIKTVIDKALWAVIFIKFEKSCD